MNAPRRQNRGKDMRSVQGNLAVSGSESVTKYSGGSTPPITDTYGEVVTKKGWGDRKGARKTWGN